MHRDPAVAPAAGRGRARRWSCPRRRRWHCRSRSPAPAPASPAAPSAARSPPHRSRRGGQQQGEKAPAVAAPEFGGAHQASTSPRFIRRSPGQRPSASAPGPALPPNTAQGGVAHASLGAYSLARRRGGARSAIFARGGPAARPPPQALRRRHSPWLVRSSDFDSTAPAAAASAAEIWGPRGQRRRPPAAGRPAPRSCGCAGRARMGQPSRAGSRGFCPPCGTREPPTRHAPARR